MSKSSKSSRAPLTHTIHISQSSERPHLFPRTCIYLPPSKKRKLGIISEKTQPLQPPGSNKLSWVLLKTHMLHFSLSLKVSPSPPPLKPDQPRTPLCSRAGRHGLLHEVAQAQCRLQCQTTRVDVGLRGVVGSRGCRLGSGGRGGCVNGDRGRGGCRGCALSNAAQVD